MTTTDSSPTVTTSGTATTPPPGTVPAYPPGFFGDFVRLVISGDQAVIGMFSRGDRDTWDEDELAALVGFYGAMGISDSVVADCVELESDDDGIPVSCQVDYAVLSEGATDKLGLGTSREFTASVTSGGVTALRLPRIDPLFDAIGDHGVQSDPSGHEANCTQGEDPAVSTRWIVFDSRCGTWLATIAEQFDEFLVTEDLGTPEAQYTASCSRCHGADLTGAVGPSLLDSIAVNTSDESKYKYITEGGTQGMPAFPRLTPEQVNALIALIREAQSA